MRKILITFPRADNVRSIKDVGMVLYVLNQELG